MNLKQYFILTKPTALSCLKISAFVFTSCATIIAAVIQWKTGKSEESLDIFIATELLGNGLALLIYILAFFDGYYRASRMIDIFDHIPQTIKDRYNLVLVRKKLNPKYNFLQFEVMSKQDEDFLPLHETFRIKYLGFR